MRVTRKQIEDALMLFIDDFCMTSTDGGFSKWLIPLGAGYFIIPKINVMLAERSEFLRSTGVLCDDGTLEVDNLYTSLLPIARKQGKVTKNFGPLGNISFTAEDVEKIYSKLKIVSNGVTM